MTYARATYILRYPALFTEEEVERAQELVDSGCPDDEPEPPTLWQEIKAFFKRQE